MATTAGKVGIIACSGEEIPAGSITRQAVRRVLEALRPEQTVTLCLPLFLAGEEGERQFARQHPTITVDGCQKLCAKQGTEKYSGQVSVSLNVAEILGDRINHCHRSLREMDQADRQAVWIVAERIAAEVDALLAADPQTNSAGTSASANAACCACGSSPSGTTLTVKGRPVIVNGLALIFDHLVKKGLAPTDPCGDTLVETVRIYHPIEPADEEDYRIALTAAYRSHCRKGTS